MYFRIRTRWFGQYRIWCAGRPGPNGAHGRANKSRIEVREESPPRPQPQHVKGRVPERSVGAAVDLGFVLA